MLAIYCDHRIVIFLAITFDILENTLPFLRFLKILKEDNAFKSSNYETNYVFRE